MKDLKGIFLQIKLECYELKPEIKPLYIRIFFTNQFFPNGWFILDGVGSQDSGSSMLYSTLLAHRGYCLRHGQFSISHSNCSGFHDLTDKSADWIGSVGKDVGQLEFRYCGLDVYWPFSIKEKNVLLYCLRNNPVSLLYI